MDRNETIAKIKTALQKRSGKTWSVTGGKGTAYGWLTIDAPPKRRTGHWSPTDPDGNRNLVDTGELNGYITPQDRDELTTLLGLDRPVHQQGVSIMASNDAYQEYIDRAEGRTPTKIAQPYWD